MRAKFLLPGIALAAFVATVFFSEWSEHRSGQEPLAPTIAPTPAATVTVPSATVPATVTVTAPVPAAPVAEVPTPAPEAAAVEAAQPPLPDPSALPSYSDNQAARERDSVRSARTR
jgi:hypothetical protein